MTSKQRAYLKGLASKLQPVFHVGKNGVTPEVIASVDEALEARELVKGTVLNSCGEDISFICEAISERTRSETVQAIGKKIVFYRKKKKDSIINFD